MQEPQDDKPSPGPVLGKGEWAIIALLVTITIIGVLVLFGPQLALSTFLHTGTRDLL